MSRALHIVGGIALLAAAAALGAAMFATVSAAPCDPSLPILSDGSREAPRPWAYIWGALAFAAAGCAGAGVGLTVRAFSSSTASLTAGVGTGLCVFIGLWISGSVYWQEQCPT